MLYLFTFTEFNFSDIKLIDAIDIDDAIRTYILDDTANQSLIWFILQNTAFPRNLNQQDRTLFTQLNSKIDETFPEEDPSEYPDELYSNFLNENLEELITLLKLLSSVGSVADAKFKIIQPTIIVSDSMSAGIKSALKR